ncbi:HEAT repeat domain-containing protein [Streptomyces sp. NPDC006645]|uniref:HEAT repeat domain-containing protein n=1 Tax=unclassified Streptomyces TaxID=2593676 RepID=UPI0033A5FE70
MLDGIDDIDWSALTHAYGSAEDIPALLRAAGSADAGERATALEELVSSLCHQGSIYPATVAAVPFLARLALDGPGDRLRLTWLLHGAAEGSGREYRQARRAVAEALPALLGLAADEDPAVRQAMVWTVAACEEASLPLLPLLRARLEEEPDAEVRADLVTALGLLDVSPGTSGARARALLSAPEPPVRRAAATDLLRTAPLPLPPDLVDAALDAHEAAPADETYHPWPDSYRPLMERLMDDPDAALRAVARGLPLAWELTEVWRDRESDVLPPLAAAAVDAEGLCRVARVGAALAGGEPAPWLAPHLVSDDPAVRVAATLVAVRLRVPGAIGLALRLMDELPEESASLRLTPVSAPGLAVTAAVEVFGAAAEPVVRRIADRPRTEWVDALRDFPALAAGHVDELVRLLPASTGVLAALGPAAGPSAARALRVRAEAGDLAAALALARVTGDAGPALDVVRGLPDPLARRSAAVDVAAELGPSAVRLLPLVEERLTAPNRDSRVDAAAAIWRVTGRTHDTAPVIADQLARGARAPHPYGAHQPHLGALRALTAMRLLPAPARTAVEHIAFSPRRVVSGSPCVATPHPDLTARELARGLLALT